MDEEQKMGNVEIEQKTMPIGEAMPAEAPAQMPSPAPAPAAPAEPSAPTMPQQPSSASTPVMPQVDRMEIPMQPIDLSGKEQVQMQSSTGEGDDRKKKMIIIAVVVVVGLLAGLGAFLVWRMTAEQAEVASVVEQTPPITVPTLPPSTPQVVAPEPDAIATIEQDLGVFNVAAIDAELQASLNEINAAF